MVNIVVPRSRSRFLAFGAFFAALAMVFSMLAVLPASAEETDGAAANVYTNPDGSPAPDPNRSDLPQAVQDAEAIKSGEGEQQIESRSLNAISQRPSFNPARIIDDEVFFNPGTMTVAQIQAFLNQRLPSGCSAYENCLRNYRQDTNNIAADKLCAAYQGAKNESAATIIFKVAQACKINPQVLMVTMQKEQSLLTLRNPSVARYNAAMGMACPDTAPCDPRYANFFGQIFGGARQFQSYAVNTDYFTWFPVGRSIPIYYNFNKSCGYTNVVIQNKATAGLYYYTPYQPNSAALAAGYGTGDSCSAYGNRDFFYLFNDWFGSTLAGGTTTNPPVTACSIPSGVTAIVRSKYVVETNSNNNATVRSAPSTACLENAYELKNGTLVDVDASVKVGDYTWYRVIHNNRIGWVRGDLLDPSLELGTERLSSGSAVIALTTKGQLRGYPFSAGKWEDTVRLLPEDVSYEQIIGVGDITGDSYNDALGINQNGDVKVLVGSKSSFNGSKPLKLGSLNLAKRPNLVSSAGDFNGDRKQDLFIVEKSSGNLLLLPGNGSGSFGNSVLVGSGWKNMKHIIGGYDFNGDSKTDLIGVSNNGLLILYPGNGKGGWGTSQLIGEGWQNFVSVIGVDDFSGDGKPDLLGLDISGNMHLFTGVGNGRVSGAGIIGKGWKGIKSISAAPKRPAPVSGVESVMTYPEMKPTQLDVLGISGDRALLKYVSKTANRFEPKVIKVIDQWTGTQAGSQLLRMGDFDGDGYQDIAGITSDGQFRLYRGNINGGYDSRPQTWNGWKFEIVVGGYDFDGDLKPDVLAMKSDKTLFLYPGNGQGGFKDSKKISHAKSWQDYNLIIPVGDFDTDGKRDLMARKNDGTLWLISAASSVDSMAHKQIGVGWGGMKHILSPGDFDKDGNSDVFGIKSSGELYLYSGDGKGSWKKTTRSGQGWLNFISVR